MTGRRKSCKSCKKVAANSFPFVETNVPVVDGFLYQNSDHDENPTPGFSSRVADAISDPPTAGIAVADAALGRTEPTPGFRKTASRKAAIQASSSAVVAQQTAQQHGNVKNQDDNKDDGKNSDENNNCSSGDKKDPKDAAGCSDQDASKSAVAVSVSFLDDASSILNAQKDAIKDDFTESIIKKLNARIKFGHDPFDEISKALSSRFKNTNAIVNVPDSADAKYEIYHKVLLVYNVCVVDQTSRTNLFYYIFSSKDFDDSKKTTKQYQNFQEHIFASNYMKLPKRMEKFFIDAYLFLAEVGIHTCFDKKSGGEEESSGLSVSSKSVVECLVDGFGAKQANADASCLRSLGDDPDTDDKKFRWVCFLPEISYPHDEVVSMYLYGQKLKAKSAPYWCYSKDEQGSELFQ